MLLNCFRFEKNGGTMPIEVTTEINPDISPMIARKSEVDQAAEEIRARRELPKKPGDTVTFSELKQWIGLLKNPEQKQRLALHVYRTDPIIVRQQTDPEADNSIDVIFDVDTELTEDYFIERHGGGKYQILVKDLDKPKTQKGGFFTANLYIPMTLHPPKLDLREVDWDHKNNKGFKSWAKSQKLIDDNNMPVIEKKADAPAANSDAMVQAMKLAMDFASKMDEKQQANLKRQLGAEDTLGKSIGDILLEKMKQDDPNKQLTTLTTLLAAMKANQPEIKPQTSELATVMPLMVAMMQSGKDQTALLVQSMQAQQTMMIEMFKASNTKGGEQVDEVDRLKSLIEVAKMMKGGGVEREKSVTEQVIEAAESILPPVLLIVGNIMATRNGGMGQTISPPSSVSAASAAQDAARQANQQLPPPAQNGAPPVTQDQARMALTQFAPLISQALANGKEGWEFAGDVENLFGTPTVAMMIKDGAEPLITIAKSLPDFWMPLVNTYGELHLVKWVRDFVNYKEEIAKAIDEDEKEPEG